MISLTIKSLQALLDDGDPDVKLLAALPSRPYTRAPANVVNSPEKVEGYRRWIASQPAVPPDLRVVSLKNSVVWGPGIVIIRRQIVLKESLLNLHDAKEFFSLRLVGTDTLEWSPPPEVHKLKGAARPVIIKQTWDEHYGHWLIEGLPRAFWWTKLFPGERPALMLSTPPSPQMQAVVLTSLQACGIPESGVHFTSNVAAYKADEWLYVSPITVQPWVKSPLVFDALEHVKRALTSGSAEPHSRRIYLSRNRQGKRRLLNEPEILARLSAEGYEVLNVEDLSLAQQAAKFNSASHIVGNLGGAFSNLAFCRPGTRILALTTPWMFDDFFWDVASHIGASYHSLHGTVDDGRTDMQADFSIPMDAFDDMYDRWKLAD